MVKSSKYDNAHHPQMLKNLEWLSVHDFIQFDTGAVMYKVHNEIAPN